MHVSHRAPLSLTERFFTLFPVPKLLAMPGVGWDLSDHAIRFVELVRSREGLRVGRCGARALPSGAVVDGEIIKQEEIKAIVRDIRQEHGLDFIHASLPGEKAYVFNIRIPGVDQSAQDMRNIIEFKLEEHVPIAPQDALFDYTIIARDVARKATDVSVTVVQKALVEAHLELFHGAGLSPLSFEVEGEAIVRAVVPEGDMRTLMIVDFGAVKTGLVIVSRGGVQFTSFIELSGRTLTAALQERLSLSYFAAEEIKKEKGFAAQKDNEQIFNALAETVGHFKDEINRHLVYWNTREEARGAQRSPIAAIILCGGGSNLIGLPEYVASALGKEVSLANVWCNAFSLEDYIPKIPFDQSLSYVTAVGLALKGVCRAPAALPGAVVHSTP